MDVAPPELETFFQRRSINIALLRSERNTTCVETLREHARTRGMNLVGRYAEPFFHRAFSSFSPVLACVPRGRSRIRNRNLLKKKGVGNGEWSCSEKIVTILPQLPIPHYLLPTLN